MRPFCLLEQTPALKMYSCHSRTSEVYSYLTISSAGIVFSKVVGTLASSCNTRMPASTGEGHLLGNAEPCQGGAGLVCSEDSRSCLLGFSNISHPKLVSSIVDHLLGLVFKILIEHLCQKCFYVCCLV